MRIILLFLVLFISEYGFSQTETFVYCLSGDSIVINKINETTNGDTIFKLFAEDYTNSDFTIAHLNDTLYSLYNDTYYFLGTNQATVGDQWHPLRYNFMTFHDSSWYCPNLMNLEVTAVSQISFGGNDLNVIQLTDLDLEFANYEFIEGVGVTKGGPLYNLSPQHYCDLILDFPSPYFMWYAMDADTMAYETCASTVGINNQEQDFYVTISETYIEVFSDKSIRELSLVALSGQELSETTESKINITRGISDALYLLRMEFADGTTVHKLIHL